MPRAPLWKLRRLAPRAKRVIERRKQQAPVLLAYELTLIPAADAFIAAYDLANRAQGAQREGVAGSRSAVYDLVATLRGWMPLLVRDIPGFEGVALDPSGVPDDAIEEAARVLGMVSAHGSAADGALPYRDICRGELEAKLAAARKELNEAEAAGSDYQQRLAAARTAAAAFNAELKSLRRTLEATLGRQDRDYQVLRVLRAGQRDEEDPLLDEDGPALDQDEPVINEDTPDAA